MKNNVNIIFKLMNDNNAPAVCFYYIPIIYNLLLILLKWR